VNDDSQVLEPDVSAENPLSDNWVWVGSHRPPVPRVIFENMTRDWAAHAPSPAVHPMAAFCASRRERLGEQFPNTTLVIATGNPKVRANDCDFRFRPGSDFFYLTGCEEPNAVLVLRPGAEEPTAVLYVPRRRDHTMHEFFTDARYGELWVGARRGVAEAASYYQIATAALEDLESDLAELAPSDVRTVRGFDERIDALIKVNDEDAQLTRALSEMRLVKDEFEIAQLQLAVDYTVKGFEDVVRALPAAVERGERVIEGVFHLRARVEGNDVGYDTIAASGSHATTLHWTRNDGPVGANDLLLLDAGVECHHLYTADVTRTMPVNGVFSPIQRKVYQLVLDAQKAGIAAVKPGAAFMAPHEAAMLVLARGLYEWGILKEEPEVAVRKDRRLQHRYTLHGTSHMLGIDVHDCAGARDEVYLGDLAEGYVLTVEPGLYFQPNDLTVPEEYRGIGVRIEDDVLVTRDGSRNLSAALPREVDEIEAWMAKLHQSGPSRLGL